MVGLKGWMTTQNQLMFFSVTARGLEAEDPRGASSNATH